MQSLSSALDYMAVCSEAGLESFELSRLNRAAMLRKEIRDVIEEWIECEVEARVARWKIEANRAGMPGDAPTLPSSRAFALPEQLALPLPSEGPLHGDPLDASLRRHGGGLFPAAKREATTRADVNRRRRLEAFLQQRPVHAAHRCTGLRDRLVLKSDPPRAPLAAHQTGSPAPRDASNRPPAARSAR